MLPIETRCTPGLAELGDRRHAGKHQHVDREVDRADDGADVLDRAQSRRVERVGPGLLVGLKPRDRVVEVGVTAQQVLRPRGQREA